MFPLPTDLFFISSHSTHFLFMLPLPPWLLITVGRFLSIVTPPWHSFVCFAWSLLNCKFLHFFSCYPTLGWLSYSFPPFPSCEWECHDPKMMSDIILHISCWIFCCCCNYYVLMVDCYFLYQHLCSCYGSFNDVQVLFLVHFLDDHGSWVCGSGMRVNDWLLTSIDWKTTAVSAMEGKW